jgi:DNA polymerase-4
MDAFFASIEQLDNPPFRGKPLIVGGSPQSRGVVAACSYEARRFGVHSAMSCAKAAQLCPQSIFTRPRMSRYREISQRIMMIFHEYTPLVEPLSLDEAFLDVTNNICQEPSATLLAQKIRRQIYQDLQLTASAGVSFNKFLAKVASDVNKPDGITTIAPIDAEDFLARLPIGRFHGVGKVTEQKMKQHGIQNGKDLLHWSEDQLVFRFGKIGSFFYNIVRGIDDRPVEPSRVRKSIGSETTLPYDTIDIAEIREILSELAADLEETLQKKQCGGFTLTMKIRYFDFTTITRSQTVRTPIFSHRDIMAVVPGLLAASQAGYRRIRLLGLSLSKLTTRSQRPYQLPLPFGELATPFELYSTDSWL